MLPDVEVAQCPVEVLRRHPCTRRNSRERGKRPVNSKICCKWEGSEKDSIFEAFEAPRDSECQFTLVSLFLISQNSFLGSHLCSHLRLDCVAVRDSSAPRPAPSGMDGNSFDNTDRSVEPIWPEMAEGESRRIFSARWCRQSHLWTAQTAKFCFRGWSKFPIPQDVPNGIGVS